MNEKIIMAGFGGQGVMLIGQLLTYAGMYENKEVSWLPSYGPEMRGGTANCHVCISDKPISSPIISKATSAIIMNNLSLTKFEPMLIEGGDLFVNASLVDIEAERSDINIYKLDANSIAESAGSSRSMNMAMLGAYFGKHPCVSLKTVERVLTQTMTGSRAHFVPINMQALSLGIEMVQSGQALAR
ncbi:MAG: 2-oxoacid:acceptor oxidoreductase family protein [Eubacteriaceae bacterium]|jgi:2-oxoglutarate ferredoxin oxidoreductase subunit gamma|nr:2-oxoacid:acceptor oxidoreductase family protein [Eubacteriaceae bacterium]